MFFATLAASHVWTSKKLADAEKQLRRVRNDYHLLNVQDSSQIYLTMLASNPPYYFQWRVSLPTGRDYQFCLARAIDHVGNDQASTWKVPLQPGTGVLTLRILERANDQYQGELTVDWEEFGSGFAPTRRVVTQNFKQDRGILSQGYWKFIKRVTSESEDEAGKQYRIINIDRIAREYQGPYSPTKEANLVSMGFSGGTYEADSMSAWIEPVTDEK